MQEVVYGGREDTSVTELAGFYARLSHHVNAAPEQFERMIANSAGFVTARVDGNLIGVARGVCDGVRGYLTECKLDPAHQGPAAVTRTDGRIEHDQYGIAAEMARRVLDTLRGNGIRRIDVVAWGTEVDFLEELGFKRRGGLIGMTMQTEDDAELLAHSGAGQSGSA